MAATPEYTLPTPSSGTLCAGCRQLSRLLRIVSAVLLVLLQGMTFFVALNGGYDTTRAAIFAAIPLFGPLFCAFQLVFAGTGAPLILLLLFLSGALTFVASQYIRECCACQGEDVPALSVPDILYAPTEMMEPNPMDALPDVAYPAARVAMHSSTDIRPEVSVPKPVKSVQTAEVSHETSIKDAAAAEAARHPSPPTAVPRSIPVDQKPETVAVPPERQSGNQDYDRALQDILSILNKKPDKP